LYIGINPSRANAFEDDPTIKKLIRITKQLGYEGFYIANLYAHISPEPKDLSKLDDPVGEHNDKHLAKLIAKAKRVICMWGSKDIPGIKERTFLIKKMILDAGCKTQCFRTNRDGSPAHPLYLPETNVILQEYTLVE